VSSATRAGLAHFTGGLRADLRGAPVSVTLVEAGPLCASPAASRRLARLGLLREVAPEALARDVARAVQADRYHVRRPKRALGAYLATDLPRRLVAGLLTGVPPRP
jgi:short-subunit dehydrogenase